MTIPQLVHFEYVTPGLLALVTEFAGSSLKLKDMTDEVKQQAIDSLKNLHCCGGDVRLDNILVQYHQDGIKVKLIDFGFSRRNLKHGGEGEAECEMQSSR